MKRSILVFIVLIILSTCVYSESIVIEYYGVKACSECLIVDKYLDNLEKECGVTIVRKDLSKEGIEEEFIRKAEELGVSSTIPFVLVKGIPLIGREEIEENLLDIINGCDVSVQRDRCVEKAFSLFTVISAGLIDGVNPCAMAMLIFFLTLLVGLDKKNILGVVMAYILGTFITYTVLGLGLMKALVFIDGMKTLMVIVYLVVIILCSVAFVLNIHDYKELKKGNFNMKNQLSKKVKKKIHTILENNVGEKIVYTTVFVTGAIVSILEFACTGQVYIPTLAFISSRGTGDLMYYTYILIYNICFIVPLVAVAIFVNKSKDTIEASDVLLNKLKYIKLITAVLYVVFIIYMLNRLILII